MASTFLGAAQGRRQGNTSWKAGYHGTSEGDDRVPAAAVGQRLDGPHGQICWRGSLMLQPNTLFGLFIHIIYNSSNSEGILAPLFVNVSLSSLPPCLKTPFSVQTQCSGSSLSFRKGGGVGK